MKKIFKSFTGSILTVLFLFFVLIVVSNIGAENVQISGLFIIKRGDNVLQIASNLKQQKYINNQLSFVYSAIVSGNFKKMKAGRYQIQQGQTYKDLIKKFVKAQFLPTKISIVPGKTIKDIAVILNSSRLFRKDDFLNSALNPNQDILNKFSFLSDKPKDAGLEGYLFPDNYLIDPSQSVEDVEGQILSNFDKKLTQDLRDEIKKRNRTIFQVVTMASILEKEVRSYEDRQIVSGILWKRIDNHLPLQVDSSLLYFQTSTYPDVLEKNVDSQYNTYKYAGLPRGPISNPDLDSIKAAIYPKNTDYWFYLSAPNGETIFAKTLGQQLINKAKYLTNN